MTFERLALVVSAVAAIMGWWVTNYAERVLQAPTLSYNLESASSKTQGACAGLQAYYLDLENISTQALIPKFTMVIRVAGNNKAFEKVIEKGCHSSVNPTGLGEMKSPKVTAFTPQVQVQFDSVMIAGASFRYPVFASNSEGADLRVSFLADQEFRILESGTEAWVLKSEFNILLGLFVVLFVLAIIVLLRGKGT